MSEAAPDRFEHPPLEPLRALLERLRAARIPHALGGSGLLATHGLVAEVRDWDLTVDADIETLATACAGLEFSRHGNSGCHADHKLSFERERVELIAGFAFFVPDGVVRVPHRVTGAWRGIPLASLTAWAAAYALMGELEDSRRRRERAEACFARLANRPPEPDVLAELLAQPLPSALGRRLAALRVAPRG